MAKITLGPIVQSIRGSVGGVTFRQVGAKFYCGPKSQGPVSPGRTSTEHHRLLRTATASWAELDAPVKEFWSRYHALENPRHPRSGQTFNTPYNLYTCYQTMRLHAGLDMLTDTVPEPPIFGVGNIRWYGPFKASTSPYNGSIQAHYEEFNVGDAFCGFFSHSRNGRTPGKFPLKFFPTADYGPGALIANSNWLIYQAYGYPPGLTGLTTQPAPDFPLSLVSGWVFKNDRAYTIPWTAPYVRGESFTWPVSTPIISP